MMEQKSSPQKQTTAQEVKKSIAQNYKPAVKITEEDCRNALEKINAPKDTK